jgi:hypothetical protein
MSISARPTATKSILEQRQPIPFSDRALKINHGIPYGVSPMSGSHDFSSRIVSHMVDSVCGSTAQLDPFPHVIVGNFFPPDVYDDLLDFLPADSQYEKFGYAKFHTKDGASNRMRFQMADRWLDRLSSAQRTFWICVRQALGSNLLKRAVFAKVSGGLAFRFGMPQFEAADLDAYALPELFREFSCYRIKPHPDTRRKVVTMQISLPRDDSQPEFGTEFYRRSLNPMHLMREPHGFEVVKCTPYVRNSAYAFSVLNKITWKSWHGRSTLPASNVVRNTILNIWYLSQADANQDVYHKAGDREDSLVRAAAA